MLTRACYCTASSIFLSNTFPLPRIRGQQVYIEGYTDRSVDKAKEEVMAELNAAIANSQGQEADLATITERINKNIDGARTIFPRK